MNSNQQIIDRLNILMRHELTAIDIYFMHSRIFKHMGIHKIADQLEHERIDEVNHVKLIVDRVLFLKGCPDFSQRLSFKGEQSILEMLKEELSLEMAVGHDLKQTVDLCEKNKDYGTRDMLIKLLNDSENDHIYWLEKQISLLEKIGEANYLQSAME